MRQAKDLIDAFVRKEYDTDEGADYHDLSRVDIAYTTSSDDVHELQISADLLHFRLDTYIDNRLSASEQYQSLEDMVKNCLPHRAGNFRMVSYFANTRLSWTNRGRPSSLTIPVSPWMRGMQ